MRSGVVPACWPASPSCHAAHLGKVSGMSIERFTNTELENALNAMGSTDLPWPVMLVMSELFERVKMLEQQVADLQAD